MELGIFLSEIRRKNQQQEVTGLLLYNEGTFIQVIEGTRDVIQDLFQIIKKDPRHSNIVKLLDESIESRAFPDWSMGYRKISNEQLADIPGFSNFMDAENPEDVVKGCREEVLHLLYSFRRHT
jgi:hypothetical protein